jgi:hypothetical protein
MMGPSQEVVKDEGAEHRPPQGAGNGSNPPRGVDAAGGTALHSGRWLREHRGSLRALLILLVVAIAFPIGHASGVHSRPEYAIRFTEVLPRLEAVLAEQEERSRGSSDGIETLHANSLGQTIKQLVTSEAELSYMEARDDEQDSRWLPGKRAALLEALADAERQWLRN